MKRLKRTALALLAIAVFLAVLPLFISVEDYRSALEREASEKLQAPVTVRRLNVSLLPMPQLTVAGVVVGKNSEITLGAITLAPDLWPLTRTSKVLKNVEIAGVTLTQKGLEKIPLWLRT